MKTHIRVGVLKKVFQIGSMHSSCLLISPKIPLTGKQIFPCSDPYTKIPDSRYYQYLSIRTKVQVWITFSSQSWTNCCATPCTNMYLFVTEKAVKICYTGVISLIVIEKHSRGADLYSCEVISADGVSLEGAWLTLAEEKRNRSTSPLG